jgi:cysteine desulfurase / selenocysteine lyase
MPIAASHAVQQYVMDCITEGGSGKTMRDVLNRVRVKFARLIGAEPDEIAITQNVSDGLNAIITSIAWKAGDNAVLCLEVEHPNLIYALYNMRTRRGVEIRPVPATPDLAISIEAIAGAIDEKTRLVAVSSVIYTSGARTDLNALAEICRDRGVLLLVDGAQSIGALDFNVQQASVDALAIGTSKYLCGPSGFGFLYVRRERAERMQPGSLGRYGIDLGDAHIGDVGDADYKLAPGARRFEAGSHNYMGANAVEVALDLLASVTMKAIEQHVLSLSRKFTDGLLAMGLPVMSNRSSFQSSQIVVVGFPVRGFEPQSQLNKIHQHLLEQGVKLSVRHNRLRFSFHLYNTADEVEAVLSMIGASVAVAT